MHSLVTMIIVDYTSLYNDDTESNLLVTSI